MTGVDGRRAARRAPRAAGRLREHRGAARRRPRRPGRLGHRPARTRTAPARPRRCGCSPGSTRPSGGDVLLAGRRVNGARPDDLARAGLCLVPEGRGVFPNLTVRENLRVATHAGRSLADRRGDDLRALPPPRRAPQPAGRDDVAAASSRCSPSPGPWRRRPGVLLLDELSMGLAPLVVAALFEEVDPHRRRRRRHPARRAVRPAGPRGGRPGDRARRWPGGGERDARGTGRIHGRALPGWWIVTDVQDQTETTGTEE